MIVFSFGIVYFDFMFVVVWVAFCMGCVIYVDLICLLFDWLVFVGYAVWFC